MFKYNSDIVYSSKQKTKGLKELAQAVQDELDREMKATKEAKLSRVSAILQFSFASLIPTGKY